MDFTYYPIHVTHMADTQIALSVARAELEGVYSSSNADVKLKLLEKEGITVERLADYFEGCAVLQFAFAEAKRDPRSDVLRKLNFRFGEIRQLYLPVLTATVLSQVGDVEIGPYHILVDAPADGKVDHEFMWQMSEALVRCKSILFCEKDQIGVANREVPADMMVSIIVNGVGVTVDDGSEAQHLRYTRTFYGQKPDTRSCFMSVIAGIHLVDEMNRILYPFFDVHDVWATGKIVATT